MNELMSYFIRSGLMLAVLFMLYWLFLRRDTLHQAHRYYLLVSLLVSLFIPLIRIPVSAGGGAPYMHMLDPILVTPGRVAGKVQSSGFAATLLYSAYFAGVGIFLFRFLRQLFLLARLVGRYGITPYKGLRFVLVEEEYVPFSIFNLVFIQRKHFRGDGFDRIIEHERVHIVQHHTLDLLLLELLLIVQWFNPFLWLVKGSLRSIHEYLADRKVLSGGHDPGAYRQLLLDQTFGVQFITLSNNLNQSLTKKRFIMMTKKRNMAKSLTRMVFLVPAAIAVTMLFAFHSSDHLLAQQGLAMQDEPLPANAQRVDYTPVMQDEPVFTVVEEMPKFPGGNEALTKYMMSSIKYPENARKNGIQGTVFVTFVVEKDGRISNARVLKGVDKELDEEALRVVNAMPNWKPGKEKGKPVKVQFNLPVAYKLDKEAGKKQDKSDSAEPSFLDVKKTEKKK